VTRTLLLATGLTTAGALPIVLPVLPFLGLAWSGVTSSAVCWGYRAAAVVAVLVLLRLRRGSYPAGR